ncbi:MAG: WbqC family protein [Bacteroidales bacterium]|jgi:hypothetical protein|nr:WbqC family protein [Bacteroidales bacterium]
MNESILITAYFPPISYFSCIKNSDNIYIEAKESYQRQTIRNRCHIQTANGIQTLSIPIQKSGEKLITSVKIDYSTPWNHKHAHAIRSAYGKTAFFPYYFDELISPLFEKHETLFELNQAILKKCLNILNIHTSLIPTQEYLASHQGLNDLRTDFSKKNPPYIRNYNPTPYIQAFSDRYPFVGDLSIIDLIFNVGNEGVLYL